MQTRVSVNRATFAVAIAALAAESIGMPKLDEAAPRKGPPVTFRRPSPKIRRNAACVCGSGKKFKRCCAQKEVAQ